MTERPILFSGPMVRAILDGLKTQTRRVVKIPEWVAEDAHPVAQFARVEDGHSGPGWYVWHEDYADEGALLVTCPYGVPGDRLWVKETWSSSFDTGPTTRYRADGGKPLGGKWKPPIFMPRWASRLTLDVTGVRVERVQGISNEGAFAEGIPADVDVLKNKTPREMYGAIWDSINGKRPGCAWADNPWVWVVEFRPVKP